MPAYNAARYIGEQLASLTRQDFEGPFEVIVADNGSTDETVEVAKSFIGSLDLHLVDASETRGAGPARNAGVEAATGDLLVFADSDDVASASWLRNLVAAAPNFDLTTGPYDLDLLNAPVVQAWVRHWPKDQAYVADGFLPFAVSGNLAVWRKSFAGIGGFHEGVAEDVEFSWRAQLRGYTVGFTPDAVMHHRLRSTLRGHAIQHMRWGKAGGRNYRTFRDQGMPRPRQWRRALSLGKWMARTPWHVFNSRKRGFWLGELATRLGRVLGSIRYRVLFL